MLGLATAAASKFEVGASHFLPFLCLKVFQRLYAINVSYAQQRKGLKVCKYLMLPSAELEAKAVPIFGIC